MQPKVSVCIPAYKRVAFLRKALESVFEQTFNDYEIIITDDSPDDSVKNLLTEFKFNNKLKYFHNSHPLGSPSNWNFAESKAEGEYIKIMHCDDYFTSNESLAKYVELLDKNPDSDFAFSSTRIVTVPANKEEIYTCSKSKLKKMKQKPEYLFFRNLIGAPSATIYRRKAMLGFDENLKWLVDIDLYIRFINNNNHISHTSEPLICTINGGEGQITQIVKDDRKVQIGEHIYEFEKIADRTQVNLKYFSLFFRLLLRKYEIKDMDMLQSIYPVTAKLIPFFNKVIFDVNNKKLITKFMLYFYNSAINKYIFRFEIFEI